MQDGHYLKILERNVLEILDEYGVEETHESFEGAVEEINKHAAKLKYKTLTILPIIRIDYEGEIC